MTFRQRKHKITDITDEISIRHGYDFTIRINMYINNWSGIFWQLSRDDCESNISWKHCLRSKIEIFGFSGVVITVSLSIFGNTKVITMENFSIEGCLELYFCLNACVRDFFSYYQKLSINYEPYLGKIQWVCHFFGSHWPPSGDFVISID